VVAARCPKLAAQLRCGLRESTSGEIAIGHHAYPVFRKLVEVAAPTRLHSDGGWYQPRLCACAQFLYTDRVEVEPDDALDLLQAADGTHSLVCVCGDVCACAVLRACL
jgi:hypothetical protein